MTVTPEMNALLERQRAYFASDEHIKQRVAIWADTSVAERFSYLGSEVVDSMTPEAVERLHRIRSSLPEDTIEILASLRRSR